MDIWYVEKYLCDYQYYNYRISGIRVSGGQHIFAGRDSLMTTEPPIAIEINCETGIETIRPLTAEEITQRNADVARAEAERAEKEAKDATELAERTALATWIAGQSTLPEAARNALARATGVTLPGGTG
jgi:hypothetical protein